MEACDGNNHAPRHLKNAGDNANVAAHRLSQAGDDRMAAEYHHQDLIVSSALDDVPGMVSPSLGA